MKTVNKFMKNNILTFYVGILLIFFVLMLTACEKEPIEPYDPPEAVNPAEIEGTWDIVNFYLLEEGYRLDVSAWVEYVNDSVRDIGTLVFEEGEADFTLMYGTRSEGYGPSMRWSNNFNSALQDSSTLGWNWRAEKPLCNITDYNYTYNPAQYFLGMDIDEWTTTYKTENRWVIENYRYYDNQLELTGEHYQYRELTLER
tara:strand:- start:5659 stop:6258 length:600 start_codon:yes stop_codon:yes gene_type:complete